MKRSVRVTALLLVLLTLIPTGIAIADSVPSDCADGQWEVRPNQTLGTIAFNCQTTVAALVAYNNIDNPNLINTGQIILIPPADYQGAPSDAAPAPAPAAAATPVAPPQGTTVSSGGVTVTFGPVSYQNQGRSAVVNITVTNNAVLPAIEGGRQYFQLNPDGGMQNVTLLGVDHLEVPIAGILSAPVWQATVTTSDGNVWVFPVGCFYREEIRHTGYEPTGPNTGFTWDVLWTGGFYDCGNEGWRLPADFAPGSTATVPLTVYLQHPRQWESAFPPVRTIARIDLALWRSDGTWLGTVGSVSY